MSKRAGLALFLAMSALFLLANYAAYEGYFQDDEIHSISWSRLLGPGDFAKAILTPAYLSNNFRPVAQLCHAVVAHFYDLDFRKYLIPVHAFHLLNVWLVWLLARRLGIGVPGACAGALFLAFHMALFDAYWKPMYIFDVVCAFFSLLSLLLWAQGRWILSFIAFWLAFKSKELAIMLPVVLLLYEIWFGRKRWQPLAPFFLVSLSFGLQGILASHATQNEYTLRFTPDAVLRSARFYASRIFLFPYLGFVLPAVPLFVRDRRVWFGLSVMCLFFLPLLFLPGRLFSAYCYLPLTGLAIAFAAFTDLGHSLPVALFFALWIPWNIHHLRLNRRQALAIADENRAYIAAVGEFVRSSPDTRAFVYDGRPSAFHEWGIEGALHYFHGTSDLQLYRVDQPDARKALQSDSVAILVWDFVHRKLRITARDRATPDVSYIEMDSQTPLWQLGDGWYGLENGFRWMKPHATARLMRPSGAEKFALSVNIGSEQIQEIGKTEVRVQIDGELVGKHAFTAPGWTSVQWDLRPAAEGRAQVIFEVVPEYHPGNKDPRTLGVAVAAFGFLPRELR